MIKVIIFIALLLFVIFIAMKQMGPKVPRGIIKKQKGAKNNGKRVAFSPVAKRRDINEAGQIAERMVRVR